MKNFSKAVALLLLLALGCTFALAAPDSSGTAVCPIAENLELTTYRGVSVGGRLSAVDPDGQAVVYEICTPPVKGSIELGEGGEFIYTPNEGRRGKDYFGYRAIDEDGNCSQEATVIIRILKQKTKVTYSDTRGRACGYAAALLAENGIFTGEMLAGEYVFSPNAAVSRSEFLMMCMTGAGMDADGSLTTGFSDDELIAAWARPYAAAALRAGIVNGYPSSAGAAVFMPDEPVTAAEAAVMLDRTFCLTDAVSVWSSRVSQVPAWAVQSVANLYGCGLAPRGMQLSQQLTRAEAAQLLAGAMELASRR